MREMITFNVSKEDDGQTVESFLRGKQQVSARMLRMLKRIPNGITRNSEHIRSIDILNAGDILIIKNISDDNDIPPNEGKLDILYEDDDVLLINKPPFMPIHPTRNHQSGTLANIVSYYQKQQNENYAFRAIGRLDRDTSGVVLLAKHMYAATVLTNQIHHKQIQKTYLALVQGDVGAQGEIKAPIYRPNASSTVRIVDEKGVFAHTKWQKVKGNIAFSLLKIQLETGRTHQIRVHFSHIGHPLLGDDMYKSEYSCTKRQALHCFELSFIHPILHKCIKVSAPLPKDMRDIADKIGNIDENV